MEGRRENTNSVWSNRQCLSCAEYATKNSVRQYDEIPTSLVLTVIVHYITALT